MSHFIWLLGRKVDLCADDAEEQLLNCIDNAAGEGDARSMAYKLIGELVYTRAVAKPFAETKAHNPNRGNNPRTCRTMSVPLPEIKALRDLYHIPTEV